MPTSQSEVIAMRTLEQAIRSSETYHKAAKRYTKVSTDRRYPSHLEKSLAEVMGMHGGPFHEARITVKGDAFGCGHTEDYEGQLTTYMTWPELRALLDTPKNGYRVEFDMAALKVGDIPSKRSTKKIRFQRLDVEAMVAHTELKGSHKAWERVRVLADIDGDLAVTLIAEHMLQYADYRWLGQAVRKDRSLFVAVKGYLFDEPGKDSTGPI